MTADNWVAVDLSKNNPNTTTWDSGTTQWDGGSTVWDLIATPVDQWTVESNPT